MATNLNIDAKLLTEAQKLGGKKTKRETVNEALAEYVQRRKQKSVLKLFGTLNPDLAYDYKALRRKR
jgi:Arc/MetJ family transcription regulator